jgi:hypothetical protein
VCVPGGASTRAQDAGERVREADHRFRSGPDKAARDVATPAVADVLTVVDGARAATASFPVEALGCLLGEVASPLPPGPVPSLL